jgi:hypothetical protein
MPMTEAEWWAAVDPQAMLEYHAPLASQRKLRLAAVACARLAWAYLSDRWSRQGIEAAEQFADRQMDRVDFEIARESTLEAVRWAETNAAAKVVHASRAAAATTMPECGKAACGAAKYVILAAGEESRTIVCSVLRDIFGNPFRPTPLELSWLGRDGEIKLMARKLYDDRRYEELSRLADALAAEGCRDVALLEHCRRPGLHSRGCWVLDLLTGRT